MAASTRPTPGRERGKSCTSDILGGVRLNGRVKGKWAQLYQELTELRNQFLGNRAAMYQSAKETSISTSEDHIADAATDSYDRDWAFAMISSDQNALYEIEQALTRIQEGTYGVCELTGKPIEAARLRAIPWTRFSAQAQAELESRGASKHRVSLGRLGQLGAPSGDEPLTDEAEEMAAAGSER